MARHEGSENAGSSRASAGDCFWDGHRAPPWSSSSSKIPPSASRVSTGSMTRSGSTGSHPGIRVRKRVVCVCSEREDWPEAWPAFASGRTSANASGGTGEWRQEWGKVAAGTPVMASWMKVGSAVLGAGLKFKLTETPACMPSSK